MTQWIQIQQPELEPEPLYLQDEGPAVIQLQLALTALNCYHSDINGQFDSITQQALMTFQNNHQLNEAGYFGPETWYAITFWANEEQLPNGSQWISKLWAWGYKLVSQMRLRPSH